MRIACSRATAVCTAAWVISTSFADTPRPLISPPTPSSGNVFGFQFSATPGLLYDIETSTNLFDWDWLETVRAHAVEESFSDVNSSNAATRFYRVADLSMNITVEGSVE